MYKTISTLNKNNNLLKIACIICVVSVVVFFISNIATLIMSYTGFIAALESISAIAVSYVLCSTLLLKNTQFIL